MKCFVSCLNIIRWPSLVLRLGGLIPSSTLNPLRPLQGQCVIMVKEHKL